MARIVRDGRNSLGYCLVVEPMTPEQAALAIYRYVYGPDGSQSFYEASYQFILETIKKVDQQGIMNAPLDAAYKLQNGFESEDR